MVVNAQDERNKKQLDSVGCDGHQYPAAVVSPAVGVHEGLEVVHARVDHGLHRGLQIHPIPGPPNREAVLSGMLVLH